MASRKRFVEIIGVPVDLGAGRRGVDMGPSAIRIADLEPRLEALGLKVLDSGDIDVMIPETQKVGAGKLRYKAPILSACEELMKSVDKCLTDGQMPLVLGGDHSIAIGSVAGSTNFYAKQGEDRAYTRDMEYVREEVRRAVEAGATEIHSVGGLHPYLPFE